MKTLCALLMAAVIMVSSVAMAQPPDYMEERPTKRVALVIGNKNYQHQGILPSSAVDAREVAKALRQLGFAVTEAVDVKNAAEFWHIHFMPFLASINENDFALFFFSGHGLTYGGENLLVMLEAQETIPESKALEVLVPLTSLRDLYKSRKPGFSLFLLDACRSIGGGIRKDNGAVEAVSKGFAQIQTTTENVVLGFSSDFGRISKGREEDGKMSFYTEALLQFLSDADKEFQWVKDRARLRVIFTTQNTQTPWFSESDSAVIYTNPSQLILDQERVAWEAALKTKDFESIWVFANQYAVSRYAASAKRWLADHPIVQAGMTVVSPAAIERAWNPGGIAGDVTRIDGPFGFPAIARMENVAGALARRSNAEASPLSPAAGAAAEALAGHRTVVVAESIDAKSAANEAAPTLTTIAPGTKVAIKDVVTDVHGETWLRVDGPAGDAYLPTRAATVSAAPLGASLREIEVPPAPWGLSTLIEARVITEAVADLQRGGHSISRVSIASPAAQDRRLRAALAGRIAHALLVLEQAGVPRASTSAVSGLASLSGENLRIRFFGK
jgi:hypothetical protein